MTAELIDLVIPVLTPIIIHYVKRGWQTMPTVLIPLLAAALGPLQDLLLSLASGVEANPVLAIALGLAGVGVREAQDQAKQAAAPNTKPSSKIP